MNLLISLRVVAQSMSQSFRFSAQKKIACSAMIALLLCAGTSFAQTVTVSSNVVGETPSVIGLNSGNWRLGANTVSYWRWTGVNGARIFTSAPNIERDDDIPGHGDGVNSEASFVLRRRFLRSAPTSPIFINFAEFESAYQSDDLTFINYDLAYGELSSNGIRPLAIINRTVGRYPFDANGTADGWADRWEHWQHYYAQAYYLGSNYDVERYSMYNEPDHSSQSVTQADYLNRLQLASDAIQSALEDVNRDFGKNLVPNIAAPITAGGANEYFRRTDNSDTRDDNQGWGELVINNLNTNVLGEPDPNFQLVHTYAYQQYNADGRRYASDLGFIQEQTINDIITNGINAEVNFGLTEFNVHSNGVFEDRSDDLNTPSRYALLGGIFTGLVNQQVDDLYLFKFDSNAEDDFLQKNAIFTNSRFDAPYNVGGATSAAGVLKLLTKGFVGAQSLLEEPSHSVNNLDVAASYNPTEGRYYLLSANESSSDRDLTFDLSALNIETGAVVQIEEVSEGNIAEVTQRIPLPANGRVSVEQTGESVMLVSVSETAHSSLSITPTDDATVLALPDALPDSLPDSPVVFDFRTNGGAGGAVGADPAGTDFDPSTAGDRVTVGGLTARIVDITSLEYDVSGPLPVATGRILSSAAGDDVVTNVSGQDALGIRNPSIDNDDFDLIGDGTESSDLNPGETVTFTFDHAVQFTAIELESVQAVDSFDVLVDGVAVLETTGDDAFIDLGGLAGLTIEAGSEITFAVDGVLETATGGPTTSIRIETFTVDIVAGTGTGNQNADSINNVFVRNIVNDTNTPPNGRAVGLLQFDISAIGNDLVDRAIIQVNGEVNEGNADFVVTHVFGIRGDDWDEDTVTWNDVNNLLDVSQQRTRALIADNFVTGVSDTAEFLGHLTFSQSTGLVSLDITDYLNDNLDSDLRLLIAREIRVDGEAADRSDGAVRFDSRNDVDGLGPRLLLEVTEVIDQFLLGDVNLDGVVDFADIPAFIAVLISGDYQLEADCDQNDLVNFADIPVFIGILTNQ